MLKILSVKSGNKYCYDSLTGKIITIHLTEEERRNNISDDELTSRMINEKIVDNGRPLRIRWMFSYDEYVRQLSCEIPSIVLELTDMCNLKCQYCTVSGDACESVLSPHHMSEETLMKSLDFFIKHNTESKSAHVGFYGGEALLCFPMIQKSVDYMNHQVKNKVLSFDISTNGLLLTDDVAKWLSAHPTVQVTCTVNGPYHDKYRKNAARKGSLDSIMQNLLHIKKCYPSVWDNQIRFIANVDTEDEIPALLEYYETKLGKLPGIITNIQWAAQDHRPLPTKCKPITIDFSVKSPISEYYAHTLSSVKRRKRSQSTDDAIIGSCFPCRVKMFVHTDGRLSFCEQVSYRHSIGDIENGFDMQVLKNLYTNAEKLFSEKCRYCWAQKMCDVCLSALIDCDGHLLERIPDEFCAKAKESAEKKLQLFCQVYEEAPELIDKI